MKFGKQLRLKAVRAWLSYYVDYERLKGLAEEPHLDSVDGGGSSSRIECSGLDIDTTGGGEHSDNDSIDVSTNTTQQQQQQDLLRSTFIGDEVSRTAAIDTFLLAAEEEIAKAAAFYESETLAAEIKVENATLAVSRALQEAREIAEQASTATTTAFSESIRVSTTTTTASSSSSLINEEAITGGAPVTPLRTIRQINHNNILPPPPSPCSTDVAFNIALTAAHKATLDASDLIDDLNNFASCENFHTIITVINRVRLREIQHKC